jgi:hypothetical protein
MIEQTQATQQQATDNAVSTAAATKPAKTAKKSTGSTAKPAASKKTSKAASKKSRSAKTSPATNSTFKSDEFREKMSALMKERGGFKRTSPKEFKALSDSKKVNVTAKRHYHKLKIDGKANAWGRAVAAARKELGIAAE